MKRFFAVLIALMMFCAVALAEEQSVGISSNFNITFTTPDGYTYEQDMAGGVLHGSFVSDDETKPQMMLVIAFSEEHAGKTLNDMTQEELNEVIEENNLGFVNPVTSIEATSHGTQLILTRETAESDPYLDFTTIYQGYYITLTIFPQDGIDLTDGDVARGLDLLSDMEFVHPQ